MPLNGKVDLSATLLSKEKGFLSHYLGGLSTFDLAISSMPTVADM